MTLAVHIVGAGPAGCATALSLQKSAKELEQDISISLIMPNEKGLPAIGETIPPAASERLNELGLAHLLNDGHLECPGSISIWGNEEPGYNDLFFTPVGKGYHLDRNYFNSQMLEACRLSGIELLSESKVVDVTMGKSNCVLTLNNNGQSRAVHSDFVVDASGIQASIARKLGTARNEYDSVISLCAFYDAPKLNHARAHTLVSTAKNGWWYATRLPTGQVLVSMCTDVQTLKQEILDDPNNWFNQFKKSGWFYQTCKEHFQSDFISPKQLHIRVAPSAILSNCIGKQWLAVGDAASSYDSMTSAGITKALDHGLYAGKAIANSLIKNCQNELKEYQQRIFDDFNQYLKLHQQLYMAEKRYPDSRFWQRRMLG